MGATRLPNSSPERQGTRQESIAPMGRSYSQMAFQKG